MSERQFSVFAFPLIPAERERLQSFRSCDVACSVLTMLTSACGTNYNKSLDVWSSINQNFFFLAILSFPNVVKIDIYDLWLVVRLYCVFSNKGLHFDSKFYYLLLHLSALKSRQTTLIIQHIINTTFKYDITCYGTVNILQIWFCSKYTSALQDVFLI